MKYRKYLIDLLFICLIIFIVFNTRGFYIGLYSIIKSILLPIFLSVFFAWSLYPIYKFFLKYFNKFLSFSFVIVLFLFIFFFLFYYSIPLIYNELINLVNVSLLDYISSYIDLNLFSKSISFISCLFFVIFLTLYILYYFDRFIFLIKSLVCDKNYLFFSGVFSDLNNYFKGFYILIFIEIIEYLVIYYLIGHPFFLLLALLAGFTTIIPYLGALFTNAVALFTALSISHELFIFTAIVMIVVPIFNNYVIEPKVYSNTIKIPILGIIISMIVFSSLFGILGIIFSIPMYIIFNNFIKFLFPKVPKL